MKGSYVHTKMSHHCHDEHVHPHGDGHDHAEHDHSDDITPALQFSLYQHINFDEVTALNEARHGLAREVVKKTWFVLFSLIFPLPFLFLSSLSRSC